mmetsp:Transcript_54151/g.128920  ORF Transcript_54151/g.128920 Transcript_54151/m.128920 type:complete len:250 (-) Transcript_54151:23-772(-)
MRGSEVASRTCDARSPRSRHYLHDRQRKKRRVGGCIFGFLLSVLNFMRVDLSPSIAYAAAAASSRGGGDGAAGSSGPVCSFVSVPVETPGGMSIHDVTAEVRSCVAAHFAQRRSADRNGVVHLISRHTTTAVSINEDEARLREDIVEFLRKLAPEDLPYKHNDLHLRPASDKDRAAIDRNWMSKGLGTLEEFMAQEPINAHSHLLAMVLGQSEAIPVVDGELALGQWQSVLFIDLDGPRNRTLGVQVMG